VKLLENDCAKLRKFRGQSSFTTYLTAVLYSLYRDYLVSTRGRWRPSAEARRRGADATTLERLVDRDRHTVDEAISIMLSRDESARPEHELRALYYSLKGRNAGRPKEVGDAALALMPSHDAADYHVHEQEVEEKRDRIYAELRRIVSELPPEDATIVHMRFYEGASIADIGRALRLEQKPLYRRVERALKTLRTALENAGISREDIADLLSHIEK
jgi:RNA polymerase sigma factor for flagellar operon FliA